MLKSFYKLFFVILSGLCFFSCSPEDAVVDFTNPHDTKSGSYLPNSPGLLSLGYINENSVKLTWTDNSLGEAGFIIERSDSVNDNFFAVDTAGENETSFLSKFAVKTGVNYYFRIRAYKSQNKSAYSKVVSAFLEFKSPTELSMSSQNSSDNSVELSWRNNSTLAKSIIIQSRIPSEGAEFTTAAVIASDQGSYSLKNLDRNKIYEFRVYAASEHNYSGFTNSLSVFYGFSSGDYQSYNSSFSSKIQEFSPVKNEFLATGDDYYNTRFSVYDANLRKVVFSLPIFSCFAKYNPAGNLIAIGRSSSVIPQDSLLMFVDANSGSIIKGLNYKVNTFSTNSIDFTPDGSKIVICSPLNENPKYTLMLDVNNNEQLWKVSDLATRIVKVSPDGKRIYAVQSNATNEKILVLNASDGSLINTIDPEGSHINFMALSKDGNYIAVAPTDAYNTAANRVQIINTNTLTVTNQINTQAASLEFTPDSRYLLVGNIDIKVFRLSDGFQLGTLSWANNRDYIAISCLSFNRDGTYLSVKQDIFLDILKIKRTWCSR